MTPSAATPAGRAASKRSLGHKTSGAGGTNRGTTSRKSPSQAGSAAPAATRTHRRTVRPSGPAPRSPRRVSGPATGVAGSTRLPRPRAPQRRPRAPLSLPRSGRLRLPRPTLSPAAAVGFLRSLPEHRWLDRAVRGRAWIPVLGVLLTGIVFMQVEVLKLGANIGRSMSLATELQSRNQLLRASVARLSDESRIERLAARMGMVLPGPTEVHFVSIGGPGAINRALSSIQPPDAPAFLAALAAERTTAAASNPLPPTGPSVTATSALPGGAPAATTTAGTSSGGGTTPPATPAASPAGGAATATGTAAAPATAPATGAPASTTSGGASAGGAGGAPAGASTSSAGGTTVTPAVTSQSSSGGSGLGG